MKEIIKAKRGSLQNIATACGCAKNTVSEILNGSTNYREELIRKVKHVAMTQFGGRKMKVQITEVEE